MHKNIKWIDFAKFVAIIAVIMNHSFNILYFDENLVTVFYFSVSLFILISGMTSYYSDMRHELNWRKTFFRSSKSIFCAYVLATVIIYTWNSRFFDLSDFLVHLIGFNISAPFYYVALYLQLMLVNRPLFNLIEKLPNNTKGIVFEVIIGIILFAFGHFSVFYTNILYICGGGGKLLGGTFLLLYYLGMLFARHDVFVITEKKRILFATILGGTLTIISSIYIYVYQLMLDEKLNYFGRGMNPPGIVLIVEALSILIFVYGLYNLTESYMPIVMEGFCKIGKHTLYIFLYHRFLLDSILVNHVNVSNDIIRAFVYIGVMIFAPIIIEYGLGIIKRIFDTSLAENLNGIC